MTSILEQARALMTILRESSESVHEIRAVSQVVRLAKALVDCGEARLAFELCEAAIPQSESLVERFELDVVCADCLNVFGNPERAIEIISVALSIDPLELEKVPKASRQWAVIHMGRALRRCLRFDDAMSLLTAQRDELLREPDGALLGWNSLALSNTYWGKGMVSDAHRLSAEAVVSSLRCGDIRLEAQARQSAGIINRFLCRWAEARDDIRKFAALGEKLGNYARVAEAKRALALIEWKRGRLGTARQLAEESAQMSAAQGREFARCFALEILALCNLHEGDLPAATECLETVKEASRRPQVDSSRVFLLVDEFSGDILLETGEAGRALENFNTALTKALVLAPRGDIVAEIRRRRAECFYLLGRHDEAYAEAQLGLEHTRELGDRYEEAATYRVAGLAAAALGRAEEAKQLFEQGFTLFEDIETPYEWGKLWMAFGDWLASDLSGAYHDPRMALESYHAAHYRFDTMGARAKLAEVNARIARAATAPAGAITVHDAIATEVPPARKTPPRPRASRSRDVGHKSKWALEQFGVITANPAVFEILETVEKFARGRSPILVLGESGTGKELIAHALHQHSGRKGEYMAINCATLPRDVIESELFGHVAGAFTGASREKVGLLEVCEGGTVFLDEVSEMSLELQSRLLRFLESGEIRRVGSTRNTRLTTRIVAASNREESDLRAGQGFRADLFYRLAHAVVKLPPLRLRGARDIEMLAEYFLAASCEEERKTLRLSGGAIKRLATYGWPGNVRELRSTMSQRAVLTPDGAEIQADELRLDDDAATPATLGAELAQTERRRIEEALRMSRNSKADAARLLGMPRTTLINRMQRLGIEGA